MRFWLDNVNVRIEPGRLERTTAMQLRNGFIESGGQVTSKMATAACPLTYAQDQVTFRSALGSLNLYLVSKSSPGFLLSQVSEWTLYTSDWPDCLDIWLPGKRGEENQPFLDSGDLDSKTSAIAATMNVDCLSKGWNRNNCVLLNKKALTFMVRQNINEKKPHQL